MHGASSTVLYIGARHIVFYHYVYVAIVIEDSFQTPAFQKTLSALMCSPTPTVEEAQDNTASESDNADDNDVENQMLDVCDSHRNIPRTCDPELTKDTPIPESNEHDAEPEAKAEGETESQAPVTNAATKWTCVVCKRSNECEAEKCRVCGTLHGYQPRKNGSRGGKSVEKSQKTSTSTPVTDVTTPTMSVVTAAKAATTPLPETAANTPLPDVNASTDTPTPESAGLALAPLINLPKVDSEVVVLQVCDESCRQRLFTYFVFIFCSDFILLRILCLCVVWSVRI